MKNKEKVFKANLEINRELWNWFKSYAKSVNSDASKELRKHIQALKDKEASKNNI